MSDGINVRFSNVDFNAGEELFNVVGNTDSKHILNLSGKEVPESVLDEIEKGCSLETLEAVAKDFPICKYVTQITIHGLFPQLRTRRVGGMYVNLVRNKNGSVGVRWNAIDAEKRGRLYGFCKLAGWHISISSSSHMVYKSERVTQENYGEVVARLKAECEKIDKSLFFGNASVRIISVWGMKLAVLSVSVNAFYEENFRKLAECITGKTIDELVELKKADQKRRIEEMKRLEEENAKWEAEYEAKRKATKEANEKWLAANPAPFPFRQTYTLKAGDIVAFPVDARGRKVRGIDCAEYAAWGYAKVGKSFGRLTLTRCLADGGNSDSYGNPSSFKAKGDAVKRPMSNWFVKEGEAA